MCFSYLSGVLCFRICLIAFVLSRLYLEKESTLKLRKAKYILHIWFDRQTTYSERCPQELLGCQELGTTTKFGRGANLDRHRPKNREGETAQSARLAVAFSISFLISLFCEVMEFVLVGSSCAHNFSCSLFLWDCPTLARRHTVPHGQFFGGRCELVFHAYVCDISL